MMTKILTSLENEKVTILVFTFLFVTKKPGIPPPLFGDTRISKCMKAKKGWPEIYRGSYVANSISRNCRRRKPQVNGSGVDVSQIVQLLVRQPNLLHSEGAHVQCTLCIMIESKLC